MIKLQSVGSLKKGTKLEAPKKYRVQLDFEASDFKTINELVDELNLGTRAELFRSGLRVLRWMYAKKQMGCAVVAITPEERYIEPEFEFFDKQSGAVDSSRVKRTESVKGGALVKHA